MYRKHEQYVTLKHEYSQNVPNESQKLFFLIHFKLITTFRRITCHRWDWFVFFLLHPKTISFFSSSDSLWWDPIERLSLSLFISHVLLTFLPHPTCEYFMFHKHHVIMNTPPADFLRWVLIMTECGDVVTQSLYPARSFFLPHPLPPCHPTPPPPPLSIVAPLTGLLLAIAWRAPPILSTPLHPGVLPQDVEPHPGPVLRHHYPFSGAWAVCLLHWRCVLSPLLSESISVTRLRHGTLEWHMTVCECTCVQVAACECVCVLVTWVWLL